MASETLNLALICVLYNKWHDTSESTNILIVKRLQMQMGWKMWWEIYRFFSWKLSIMPIYTFT